MHPAEDVTRQVTANDILKQRSSAWLPRSMVIAVLFHVAVFTLSPDMTTAYESGPESDLDVLEFSELDLPEPPKEIARPAAPVLGTAEIDATVTISPTTPDAWTSRVLPPPVSSSRGARDDFERFVPSMVAPELLNPDEVEAELRRVYPTILRDAGIGGDVDVTLWLDETGEVVKAQIGQSSGYELLDEAALKVVDAMRLTPAQNRNTAVRVIVTLPVKFRVQ